MPSTTKSEGPSLCQNTLLALFQWMVVARQIYPRSSTSLAYSSTPAEFNHTSCPGNSTCGAQNSAAQMVFYLLRLLLYIKHNKILNALSSAQSRMTLHCSALCVFVFYQLVRFINLSAFSLIFRCSLKIKVFLQFTVLIVQTSIKTSIYSFQFVDCLVLTRNTAGPHAF